MREIFNWFSIRTSGGHPPPVDVVVFEEFMCTVGCVLRIVILHEAMSTGVYPETEWNESLFQDVHIHLDVHSSKMQMSLSNWFQPKCELLYDALVEVPVPCNNKSGDDSPAAQLFRQSNDIMKVIVPVCQYPFQTLLLVDIVYKLPISGSTVIPSQLSASRHYSMLGHREAQTL